MFSFIQIFSKKHSTHLVQIATLIISSHQNLGPLSVLFPSDFFIKTLYTSRPNPHFNIIIPSTPGPPKYSLSFRFLIKTLYTPRPNRQFNNILPSNSGPLSFLFPSDFFTKTLYTSRPNTHFNIILPSNPGTPKCTLWFRFLHQNTLHT